MYTGNNTLLYIQPAIIINPLITLFINPTTTLYIVENTPIIKEPTDCIAPHIALITAITPSLNHSHLVHNNTIIAIKATMAIIINVIGFIDITKLRAACATAIALVAIVLASMAAFCAINLAVLNAACIANLPKFNAAVPNVLTNEPKVVRPALTAPPKPVIKPLALLIFEPTILNASATSFTVPTNLLNKMRAGPTTAAIFTILPIVALVFGSRFLNQVTKFCSPPTMFSIAGINSLPASKATSPSCLFNDSSILPKLSYFTSFTPSIAPLTLLNSSPTVVKEVTTLRLASSPIVPNAVAAIVNWSCSFLQLEISPTMELITSFMVPFPLSQFLKAVCVSLLNISIFAFIVPSPKRFLTSLIESLTLSRL